MHIAAPALSTFASEAAWQMVFAIQRRIISTIIYSSLLLWRCRLSIDSPVLIFEPPWLLHDAAAHDSCRGGAYLRGSLTYFSVICCFLFSFHRFQNIIKAQASKWFSTGETQNASIIRVVGHHGGRFCYHVGHQLINNGLEGMMHHY